MPESRQGECHQSWHPRGSLGDTLDECQECVCDLLRATSHERGSVSTSMAIKLSEIAMVANSVDIKSESGSVWLRRHSGECERGLESWLPVAAVESHATRIPVVTGPSPV